MSTNIRVVVAVVVVALTSACPKQVPPPEPVVTPPPPVVEPVKVEPTGPGLVVHVTPDDAELIIDGASQGIVSKLELENGLLPLKPGIYQVGLKRAGYVSWRAEVTVNDRPETIAVTLRKP